MFHFCLLKGRLLTIDENDADTREGEKLLRYCVDWARKRKAKFRGLEANYTLAQVMARTSGREEARAMLAEIYNWFTEGLDTEPLKDAKALSTSSGRRRQSSNGLTQNRESAVIST